MVMLAGRILCQEPWQEIELTSSSHHSFTSSTRNAFFNTCTDRTEHWNYKLCFSSWYAIETQMVTSFLLKSFPGGMLSISAFAVPSILLAPDSLVARQWKKVFDLGKASAPPIAAASALSFSFISYQWYGTLNQPKAEFYGLSAFLTICIVPYTLVLMRGVNGKLLSKAAQISTLKKDDEFDESQLPKGQSSKELVDLWATYNAVRSILPLAGSAVGLWTTIS